MALTTVRYGRYTTSADTPWGTVGASAMRGTRFRGASQNIWVHTMGSWIRKNSATTANVRYAIYLHDGSVPTTRVGYTSEISVTSSTFTSRTAAVAVADSSPSNSAIKLTTGTRYVLAALSRSAAIDQTQINAASLTPPSDDTTFYNRTSVTSPPSSFSRTSQSTEGNQTIWAEGYLNVKPEVATGLSPSGTINDTAPTFVASFRDLNGAYGTSSGLGVDTGDRMTRYAIEVRTQGSATADKWNSTYTATSTEQTNNAIARAYGGSTLTRGTTYEWRIRFYDEFNEAGDFTAWTAFTPADLGFVTTDGTPNGKTEDNTPDFQGRWTHQASLSTNAVEIRLYSSLGVLIQTSPTISKTVTSSASPGTLFTITAAETAFGSLLWGTAYAYEIRGRDTNGLWSSWSTPRRTFTLNAAPSIPSSLTPSASAVYTSYPLLHCIATDADDTTATGLEVSARIKNSSGTVLYTRAMTYSSTNNRWEYQTTPTDLASYGAYRWDASAFDGTLYSGETTVAGSRTWSGEATFTYAQGPTVTMVAPLDGDTLTASSLAVSWTTTNQAKYRVRLYADGGTTALYDSGLTVSGTSSHNIPSGYIQNGSAYDLVVDVEDTLALTGSSGIVDLSASFTPPAELTNVTAVATSTVGTNPWDTAIVVSWDQTADPAFTSYLITRVAASGPDAAPTLVARITAATATSWTDFTPVSGVEYTYVVAQTSNASGEEIGSYGVNASATATFGGIMLTAAGDAASTTQAALRYTADRTEDRTIDEAIYTPINRREPETIRSATRYRSMRFDIALPNDDYSTAAQKKAELEELDAANVTVCYRDNHGRKFYARIVSLEFTDQLPNWWRATMQIREERYVEGVV